MITKYMATKEEILTLLKKDIISVKEAVEMLNKLDETVETEPSELTYEEKVEKIVKETIDNIDFEHVFKIMQEMKWQYYGPNFNKHIVTREEVRETMEACVRDAIFYMVKNWEEDGYKGATIGIGGFEAHAWVDEGDTVIQVELKFIPEKGYGGDMEFDDLVSNKK